MENDLNTAINTGNEKQLFVGVSSENTKTFGTLLAEEKSTAATRPLDDRAIDRIIEMAWEDRTPFEAIEAQFGLPEKRVIQLMRRNLKERSFKMWRARVHSGVSQKHAKKRNPDIERFKCTRQKQISLNKISKR